VEGEMARTRASNATAVTEENGTSIAMLFMRSDRVSFQFSFLDRWKKDRYVEYGSYKRKKKPKILQLDHGE
jgi:hypothetical protein